MRKEGLNGWSLCIVGVTTLILSLGVVWVNIELVQLSYSIKELHSEISKERELKNKLEVEKMNLMSSYRLRQKAELFDLERPSAEQIRYLSGQ